MNVNSAPFRGRCAETSGCQQPTIAVYFGQTERAFRLMPNTLFRLMPNTDFG